MKIELQNKLYKKYPKIFAQKDLTIQQSCMPWGFDCGDGWYWLIENLCGCIQSYIDNNKHLKIEQTEATQVKEKFGRLDFYTSGGDELIEGMVWLTHYQSAEICEVCGSSENVSQSKGWIYTRCEKCKEDTPKKQIFKKAKVVDVAHEIWAVSQLTPSEGIEAGVIRILEVLKENDITFEEKK